MLHKTTLTYIYGKPTKGLPKRTKHTALWWKNAHPKRLTFKSVKEIEILPPVQTLNEEVYGRYNLLYDPDKWKLKYYQPETRQSRCSNALCAQCKQVVRLDNPHDYLWIPAGRAQFPTPQGYVFHSLCFRCAQCKYRFYGNVFSSKNGQFICLYCSRGLPAPRPVRRWHLPMTSISRDDSRQTGEIFPRTPHDEDWIFDPDT